MAKSSRRTEPYRIIHRRGQASKVLAEEFSAHLTLGNLLQTKEQRSELPRLAYVHPGLIAQRDDHKQLFFLVALRTSVAEISHRLIVQFTYAEKLAREVARALITRRDVNQKLLLCGDNVWDVYLEHILASYEDPERVDMRMRLGEPRIVGDPYVPSDPAIQRPDGTFVPYGSRYVVW